MKVKLDEKTIEINKLPIGKYAEFLKILKGIFAKSGMLEDVLAIKNEEFLSALPDLIAQNLPEAIAIIKLGTGLPDEEVETMGINEAIDCMLAIFEVNKYAEVYEKIKKGIARLPKKPVTPTGSPTQ